MGLCGPPLLLLFAAALARADERYDKLAEEYMQAQNEWWDKQRGEPETKPGEAKPGEAMPAMKMPDLSTHPVRAFMPKFKELAEALEGKPDQIQPITWVLQNVRMLKNCGVEDGDALLDWAFALLEKHAGDATLAEALSGMRHLVYEVDQERLLKFYDLVLTKQSDKGNRAWALFNQGFTLSSEFGTQRNGQPYLATDEDRKKAGELFRRIRSEFADTDAAKEAAPFLFELEQLQVGMKAPDIIGVGPDGKEVKLSQFLGNVVVLDFWGFW